MTSFHGDQVGERRTTRRRRRWPIDDVSPWIVDSARTSALSLLHLQPASSPSLASLFLDIFSIMGPPFSLASAQWMTVGSASASCSSSISPA